MQINIDIEPTQIIEAAAKLQLKDKLKLYERIKGDVIKFRVDELLNKFKDNDISEEEITKIVEDVRSERYKNRR